jgi:hypothetical protein
VIESAATEPSASVALHETAAFNADKALPRCILYRFSRLAHFDLAYAGDFGNIKTAVHNANAVMDDLFFEKDHAAAQLVRVTNALDAVEDKMLWAGWAAIV